MVPESLKFLDISEDAREVCVPRQTEMERDDIECGKEREEGCAPKEKERRKKNAVNEVARDRDVRSATRKTLHISVTKF